MFFCISCKKQFNEADTRFGECPYCGLINMMAQKRTQLINQTVKTTLEKIKQFQK